MRNSNTFSVETRSHFRIREGREEHSQQKYYVACSFISDNSHCSNGSGDSGAGD